jgi:hypothetical protein
VCYHSYGKLLWDGASSLHQVDIKGAYLNGVLSKDEVLYMAHPPVYKVSGTSVALIA